MEEIQGVDETRKNLKEFERKLIKRLVNAIELVAIAVADHIKVTYQRPLTGKGFTDRTGALRQSITHKVRVERGMIVAYIFAGMEYAPHVESAPHVEFVVGGKYAFMLPGFVDMKGMIIPLIMKEMKKQGLILAA